MPKNKSATVRYHAIDKRIRRKFRPFPSIEDLKEAVEEVIEKSISISSIQKDIKAMKDDPDLGYFAPIKYDKQHEGYYYEDPSFSISSIPLSEKEISAIKLAASVLAQYRGTDFMSEFEGAVDKIFTKLELMRSPDQSEFIQMEEAPFNTRDFQIEDLIDVIRNQDVIKFNYTKFNQKKGKEHIVHPYVLKEFRNRWYLTGYDEEAGKVKTFGLERISSLTVVSGKQFYKEPGFDPKGFFKYALGITTFNEMDPVTVELSFVPHQADFIKTQPWHSSQNVVQDDEKEFRITMKLMPSMELIRQVLSYGNEVKVIQPEWLKEEVRKRTI